MHDGKSKACGHRAGTVVLSNAPGWMSPHPPPARETPYFRGHVRSAWAWPCAAQNGHVQRILQACCTKKIEAFSVDVMKTLLRNVSHTSYAISAFEVLIFF